jgi:hypothetical protein
MSFFSSGDSWTRSKGVLWKDGEEVNSSRTLSPTSDGWKLNVNGQEGRIFRLREYCCKAGERSNKEGKNKMQVRKKTS